MGSLGGSIAIQGMFALPMVKSLDKPHLLALHGWVEVALLTLARLLTGRIEPRLKLH